MMMETRRVMEKTQMMKRPKSKGLRVKKRETVEIMMMRETD